MHSESLLLDLQLFHSLCGTTHLESISWSLLLSSLSRQLCVAQVQDLSKVYTTRKGSFVAAENISLDIPAGKMTALLGPSGSGMLPSLCAGTEGHHLRSAHMAMKG